MRNNPQLSQGPISDNGEKSTLEKYTELSPMCKKENVSENKGTLPEMNQTISYHVEVGKV